MPDVPILRSSLCGGPRFCDRGGNPGVLTPSKLDGQRATVRRGGMGPRKRCARCGRQVGRARGSERFCSNECVFDYWVETNQYPKFWARERPKRELSDRELAARRAIAAARRTGGETAGSPSKGELALE